MLQRDLLVAFPCAKTGHPGVGRFRPSHEAWYLVGASRQRPGTRIPAADGPAGPVTGVFEIGDGYLGCPSCGDTGILRCGSCDHMACWDGNSAFTCPTCGHRGHVGDGAIDSVAQFGTG